MFVVNAIAGLIALAIVVASCPGRALRSRAGSTSRGQLLVTGFLATLTYALIEAPRFGFGSPHIVTAFALAAVMFVAFIVVELRVDEPLVDLGFFRDRQFSGAVFLAAATFFTFGGFIYFNTLFLQDVRGYSALAAGFLSLPAAVPALIGGPLSGYLVGTRGPRGVLVGGMLVLTAGAGALALLVDGAAIGWLLLAYLVVGFGYAVLSAPVSTVAVSSMPRDQAGVAAGIASAARNVGIVLGIAVLGAIVYGRVPEVLTPASGASESAFAAFQDALRRRPSHRICRRGRRRARSGGRGGPDHAPDAARGERRRGSDRLGNVCSSLGRGTDRYACRGIRLSRNATSPGRRVDRAHRR